MKEAHPLLTQNTLQLPVALLLTRNHEMRWLVWLFREVRLCATEPFRDAFQWICAMKMRSLVQESPKVVRPAPGVATTDWSTLADHFGIYGSSWVVYQDAHPGSDDQVHLDGEQAGPDPTSLETQHGHSSATCESVLRRPKG